MTSDDGSVRYVNPAGPTADLSVPGASEVLLGQVSYGQDLATGASDFPVSPLGDEVRQAYLGVAMTNDTIGAPTAVLSASKRYEFSVPAQLAALRLLVFITDAEVSGESLVSLGGIITINGASHNELGWGIAGDGGATVANVVQDASWETVVPAGSTVGVTIASSAGASGASARVTILILGRRMAADAPVPLAWYRYDQGVTKIVDDVTQWNDQSGNGYDVSAPTVPRRPTFPAAAWGIHFANAGDGQDLDRDVSLLTPGQDRTVLGLLKPETSFGGTLCTFQESVPAFNVLFENLGGHQYVYSDDTPGASEPPNAIYDPTPQDRTGEVLVYAMRVRDGNIIDVQINSVPMALISNAFNPDTGDSHWRIGNQMNTIVDRGWQGWMRELIVFGEYLTDGQLAPWLTYLGFRGALP